MAKSRYYYSGWGDIVRNLNYFGDKDRAWFNMDDQNNGWMQDAVDINQLKKRTVFFEVPLKWLKLQGIPLYEDN